MTKKWPLGIAVSILLAGTSAGAASLVNKGGTSNVPTYEDRVWYIKASGTTCPAPGKCFCDSGTHCYLPQTVITGTIVIDRPGVTLDCQNRIIQPPRFANTTQQCTSSSECGQHSSGAKHACVSGYCQLAKLGGINIGGPLGVDDSPINIDVRATGYVQDVEVINCTVRNHYAGVAVQGFDGDNGLDNIKVMAGEYRTGHVGVAMSATDNSEVWANYVHDNGQDGLDLEYNWGIKVLTNRVESNGARQVYFHGSRTRPNMFIDFSNNWVTSTVRPPNSVPGPIGNVLVFDVEGTFEGRCESDTGPCDMTVEINDVAGGNDAPAFEFRRSYNNGPKVLLRGNRLRNLYSVVDILVIQPWPEGFAMVPVCWTKENVCFNEGPQVGCTSSPHGLFVDTNWPATCWY